MTSSRPFEACIAEQDISAPTLREGYTIDFLRASNPVGGQKKHDRLPPARPRSSRLIADGNSNKEIGAELGISVKTVEKHRQQVMNKLGIHETAGLTRYAMGLNPEVARREG